MPRQRVQPPEVTNRKNLLHKEPSVINAEMIIESLDALLPPGDEGKYARLNGINPRTATHLLLEFKNVSQISNISHMVSLTKLQLCNNVITKIERLDTLVNLVWLDLSFNSIKKIENLENLHKLECINLHRNLITHINNMENQLRLEIFIISSNAISSLEDIKYLRRFVRLQSVNLDGNPITVDPRFKRYTIAILPQVRLLDYVRISASEKREAEAEYANLLEKLAATDDKLRRRASVVEANEAVQEVHAQAFVTGFYEDQFWDQMYAQDVEGQNLLKIGDMEDVRSMFHELFHRASKELFEKGMDNYNLREGERKAFDTSILEHKNIVKTQCQKITEEFIKWSKESIRNMRGWVNMIDDIERRMGTSEVEKMPLDAREKMMEYQKHLNVCVLEYMLNLHHCWYAVMTFEMGLHEQIMDVSQELDHSLQGHINSWLEQLRGHVGVLRDIQAQLNERLVEDLITYSNFRHSDPSIPESMKTLIKDREALTAAVQASHENHNAFIDSKEEQLVSSLKKWMESASVSLTRDEVHRNRARVSEISQFADYYRKLLDEKHIISYITCFVPDVRGNQSVPKDQEEEDEEEGDEAYIQRVFDQEAILANLANLNEASKTAISVLNAPVSRASEVEKVKDKNEA